MSKANKTYHIWVLGCQMNYSDAEKLEKILVDLKYKKADGESSADLIVVVACSVRQSAIDRVYGKARNWQKRRRQNGLKTILTGCVLAMDKKKMTKLFDEVIDIKEIGKLPALLWPALRRDFKKDYLEMAGKSESSFQAFVPIMTGCDNFCAYCVVPYVRGREKSRLAKDIITECRDLIKNGYKEITLLGQNVNSYKSGSYNFTKLLKAIDKIPGPSSEAPLGAKEGKYWIRFISSHPKDFSDELIKIMADGKHITPYLHLAVQSGDDKILQAMNRKYTAEKYLNIIKKARKAMPGVMISTDIIVGFPGETKKQFQNTLKLFKEVGFDMAYISKYSPRKGTSAAQLKDNVSKPEKYKRKDAVNELLRKTALANNKKYVGREVEVLVEKIKNGKCIGKTDTFKTITFAGDKNLIGNFVKIKIKKAGSWGLSGERADETRSR